MPSGSPRRASASVPAIRETATLSAEKTRSPTGSSVLTLGRASVTGWRRSGAGILSDWIRKALDSVSMRHDCGRVFRDFAALSH